MTTTHPLPDYLKTSVVYQIFLRSFTPEGTLSAAEKMLPHIRSIGADIVYLCPPFTHDTDPNRQGWSNRQCASGIGNPSNPYRMMDYYNVDPEYGTNEDLRHFVDQAHETGLKVILDLVYFHCGPNAVFLKEHPDFIVRDADGKALIGDWKFPRLNYENPALCEYLWQNMEYCLREFDCDGFRCDVADMVPLWFWEEGRRRLDGLKPDVIMLNEGAAPETLRFAFDFCYDFDLRRKLFAILDGQSPASTFVEYRKQFEAQRLGEKVSILCFDNHDIASDAYDNRSEKRYGQAACDALLFLIYTMRGVPFLYGGQEVCDSHRHCLWGNRFYGGNFVIDWQNALTEKGQSRMHYLRQLAKLHKETPAIRDGAMTWVDNTAPDALVTYTRTCRQQKLLFAVNLTGEPVTAHAFTEGCETELSLGAYATAITELK